MNNKLLTNRKIAAFISIILIVLIIGAIDYYNNQTFTQENESVNIEDIKDGQLNIFETKEKALEALNNLKISEADSIDYNRNEQFGSWKDYSGWSTRDEVLEKYCESGVKTETAFTSGTWYILYLNEYQTYNTKKEISSNLEIDHIVPLSYAYRHGASSWDQDKREEFCNDYGESTKWSSGNNGIDNYQNAVLGNLVVSDKYSNRSKSDKGPSNWMPEENKVQYAEMWVDICSKYGISITKEDYDVLFNTLNGVDV